MTLPMLAADQGLDSSSIVVIVAALPVTLLVAWIAGRLLGVRRSVSLTVMSGLLGWAGGVILSVLIASDKSNANSDFARNALLFSAFGAMSVSVWIELLARPGALARAQSGLTTIPRPMRSMRRRATRVHRYAQITRIAAHYGLGKQLGVNDATDDSPARGAPMALRLRLALEECGGVFVKLGQVLATRPDLVSAPIAEELSKLQDHVRPADEADVRECMADELRAPVDEVFAEFDWNPVAAASIGQAYRATLPTGEMVIVKVQRPGIADAVERDLDVLDEMAKAVESRTSWGAEYGVRDITGEFAEHLREELDYRGEARNAVEIGAHLPVGSNVRVPKVHEELTSSRVLVMERLDGVSVRDHGAIDALGVDRRVLADELLETLLRQMLVDGRYHADPHPGNVMVLSDGRLGLIDFGATGVVDALMQVAVRDVMLGLATQDPELLRRAMLDVATLRRPVDDNELERALARFMAKHLSSGQPPGAAMFNDLLQMMFGFGVQLPAELSTFFRALVTLDGTLQTLAPDYDTIGSAERIARQWMRASVTPDTFQTAARDELLRLVPTLRRLPRQIDRLLSTAERDGLRARVSLFSDDRDVAVVTRLTNRVVLAFLGGSVGVVSVGLIAIEGGPELAGDTSLFGFFGYFGLFCATVLVMRVLVGVLRDDSN
ncbi:MAG: AarF/UbiB family protein [Acidimicrobiia bacterium]